MTIDHTGCVCILGHACIYLICFLERLVKVFLNLFVHKFIYLFSQINLSYVHNLFIETCFKDFVEIAGICFNFL